MNKAGASKFAPSTPRTIQEEDERVERNYQAWLEMQAEQYEQDQLTQTRQLRLGSVSDLSAKKEKLTLGYVTKDACPGKGDDIEHIPRELLHYRFCRI